MLKPVNIQSILQARTSLGQASFKLFLEVCGVDVRDQEIDDLNTLADHLRKAGCGILSFDGYYFGYRIPQIGKEFDLLRLGRESIINIELKSTCPPERVRKQLLRNNYYLKFTGLNVYAFAFVSDTKSLYFLTDCGGLEVVNPTFLVEQLVKQQVDSKALDSLFDPSNYLVSPFNSTDRFLKGEYFLTHQQEDVKSQVIRLVEGVAQSSAFLAITGAAGTGKTLLAYDIARHLVQSHRKVLIIHCGQLNPGHLRLMADGWVIAPIKRYKEYVSGCFDLVIIDEAQRIYQDQLDEVVSWVRKNGGACIFSYDKVQTLSKWEERSNVAGRIDLIPSISRYNLSEKIRTNREIAVFIKMLFSKKAVGSVPGGGNIEVRFFNNNADAKNYLDGLDNAKWEVLRFTPSQYMSEHHEEYFSVANRTSHQVIGQEFDGVAVAVDRFFSYDQDGNLVYTGGPTMRQPKCFFKISLEHESV